MRCVATGYPLSTRSRLATHRATNLLDRFRHDSPRDWSPSGFAGGRFARIEVFLPCHRRRRHDVAGQPTIPRQEKLQHCRPPAPIAKQRPLLWELTTLVELGDRRLADVVGQAEPVDQLSVEEEGHFSSISLMAAFQPAVNGSPSSGRNRALRSLFLRSSSRRSISILMAAASTTSCTISSLSISSLSVRKVMTAISPSV